MEAPSRCRSPVAGGANETPLSSGSLLSLDSSVFCSEGEGEPLALGDSFTINVGGSRFVLSQQALSCFPHTRLGKLAVVVASCRHPGTLAAASSTLELCDDANLVDNEYFFDRSSQAFRYILHYYRTGRLHVMEQLCALSFLQEIQYWGIDELSIDSCCRDRYLKRKELSETLDFKDDTEDQESQQESDQDFSQGLCPTTRQKLWDILEKPGSSTAARIFGIISIIFVVVSIANMALMSSEPSWMDMQLLEALEYLCITWFTVEFALRLLCVRNRCGFLRKVANIIDLLAILPFYITLLVESLSEGLRSLGMTLTQCYEEVGLLLLFLSVGISIFSTVEYFAEQSMPGTTFTSVPCAWWWATTSMTTVGYGDIRPDTTTGKIVAFVCILSGILVLALPIAIINDRFSACYFTLKLKEAAIRQREALKKLTKNIATDSYISVNLRDVYARSIMEMLRLKGRERASTRSSGGDDFWF
ncbi:potassium voltage-gated channel subfamily V member 1 isoform X2 [Dromiciops gliroides]|uniref:potassium voltage-gated channel subfamily V member 1 isoform X2 n=1 Tax=Dromiciops gliroides TaxID=33562 RepID=UPI001CC70E34|nr:potassium voltage-gated channel subfamily V member 1 isoform X2 [Dromiciops gliroides]